MANQALVSARNEGTTSKAIADSSEVMTDEHYNALSKANKILANLHTMYCEGETKVVKYTNGTNVSYGLSSASLDAIIGAFDM